MKENQMYGQYGKVVTNKEPESSGRGRRPLPWLTV